MNICKPNSPGPPPDVTMRGTADWSVDDFADQLAEEPNGRWPWPASPKPPAADAESTSRDDPQAKLAAGTCVAQHFEGQGLPDEGIVLEGRHGCAAPVVHLAGSVSGLQGHGCGGWVLIIWCLALLLAAALSGWPYYVLPMPGVKDRSV